MTAPRSQQFFPALFIAISIVLLGLVLYLIAVRPVKGTERLVIGEDAYSVQVAATSEARTQGLSGVAHLDEYEGLLMAFPYEEPQGIWMKDMEIPIDILWLNSSKEIVYIVENALPEWSTTKIMKPSEPALYVIELPAGAVARSTVSVGDTVQFSVNKGAL